MEEKEQYKFSEMSLVDFVTNVLKIKLEPMQIVALQVFEENKYKNSSTNCKISNPIKRILDIDTEKDSEKKDKDEYFHISDDNLKINFGKALDLDGLTQQALSKLYRLYNNR